MNGSTIDSRGTLLSMVQLSQRKRRPGMRSCQGVRIDLHRHFARASSRSERSQLCELSRPTKATLDSLRKNLAWWAVTRSTPKPSKLGNGSLRGYRRLPWTIRTTVLTLASPWADQSSRHYISAILLVFRTRLQNRYLLRKIVIAYFDHCKV